MAFVALDLVEILASAEAAGGAICATMKDSDPKALAVLCSAYTPRPEMADPTRITLPTPMITPSNVRKLRSLCPRIESIARPNAL